MHTQQELSTVDFKNQESWQAYISSYFSPERLRKIFAAIYCGLVVPPAVWQIVDGTYAAIGSPSPINAINGTVPAGETPQYDGIWPVEARPTDDMIRWIIAGIGGLATATLYWKVQPCTRQNFADRETLKASLASIISKTGSFAILASVPGTVLNYIDTMETAGLPEEAKLSLAVITSICCFIVTVVTYKKSLSAMANELLTILKQLWREPMLDPGLLIFAIMLAVFSLFTIPGFMSSLASILATHTFGSMLGQSVGVPIATALCVPFYILVVQSCFEIYKHVKQSYQQSKITVSNIIMVVIAMIPGIIIASAFAFFISNGLGPNKLNWTGNQDLVNIFLAALGAVPAGLAFTESSFNCLIKPITSGMKNMSSRLCGNRTGYQILPS
jgi:hypothetical protein